MNNSPFLFLLLDPKLSLEADLQIDVVIGDARPPKKSPNRPFTAYFLFGAHIQEGVADSYMCYALRATED